MSAAVHALSSESPQGSGLTGIAGWVVDVVEVLGPAGVALLVAGENIFPPLPSEVILPLAGYIAGTGRANVVVMIVAATIGSVVGALVLYYLGAKIGTDRLKALARRVPLMEPDDIDRSAAWFARHGDSAVLFGRMVPVVRSFVSIPAGVERMPLWRFLLFTTIGSAVWNTLFVGGGYLLGSRWTTIGEYSDWINAAMLAAIAVLIGIFVVKRIRRRATAGNDG